MKRILLSILTVFTVLSLNAQTNKTNLVVFSEDGDKFYLVINGIRQNTLAETNIRVTDLTTENFSFTIIFEDTKIPAIKKSQALPFGNEYTYRIKTDKKGKKSLKYFGETALSSPSTGSGATNIVYHTSEEVVPVNTTQNTSTGTSGNVNTSGNVSTSSATNTNGGNVNTGVTIHETSTTTSTTTTSTGNGATSGVGMNVDIKDQGNGGNVSTGVNAGGVGMNIDINVSENGASINLGGTGMNTGLNTNTNGMNTGVSSNTTSSGNTSTTGTTSTYSSTTTTTTTTTTTSTGGTANNVNTNETGSGNITGTTTTGTNTSGYTGTSSYTCAYPMGTTDFSTAKKSIESKDFEDSKFTIAKQVTKNNCLSASQIKEVMGLFDFEATKLDYAKYAYDFCYDKNNYYQLNDAFDFESSIDDLNEYIEKK